MNLINYKDLDFRGHYNSNWSRFDERKFVSYSVLYRILSPEKLDMFRRAFSDLQVCIVDEISMVGADKIYDMSRRVCEIVISEDLYGNKGTCFVGDPMQVNNAQ